MSHLTTNGIYKMGIHEIRLDFCFSSLHKERICASFEYFFFSSLFMFLLNQWNQTIECWQHASLVLKIDFYRKKQKTEVQ